MQTIGELLPNHSAEWERISKMTARERAELKKEWSNRDPGDLNEFDGYDCPICLNRGYMWDYDKEPPYSEYTIPCKCKGIRASIRRMKRSGLESVLKRCTFDKYETPTGWQAHIKEKAREFPQIADELESKWFFMGGGVGSGKTHLCTAIAREFLLKGKEVRYMLWVKQSQELKAKVNDPEYTEMLAELQKVDVLYIDDFFKPMKDERGNDLPPTRADIRLAYEIIDYRYQHRDLITIISSERHVHELEEIDSAVGSRIYEMTKKHAYNIAKSKDRNYRLRDMEII